MGDRGKKELGNPNEPAGCRLGLDQGKFQQARNQRELDLKMDEGSKYMGERE